MVVQGIIALALALPTGMLFGVGYGTGVRIGYEQIYPLLFPKGTGENNATQVKENMKQLNTIYDTIGGKEASNMGIAQGLNSARSELENNPDFQFFTALESNLSGHTPLNSENLNNSPTIDSLPLQESSDTTLARVAEINKMTDIAKMIRNLNQEEAKFIKDLNVIQAYRDRINLLRGSSTDPPLSAQIHTSGDSHSPQQHNQYALDNRTAPEIIPAPTRAPTKQETALSTYQQGVHDLLIPILNAKKQQANLKLRAKALGSGAGAFLAPEKSRVLKKLQSSQKRLQNHITQARNNILTKSRANSDWNARIWK